MIRIMVTVDDEKEYDEVAGMLEDLRDAGYPVTWEVAEDAG